MTLGKHLRIAVACGYTFALAACYSRPLESESTLRLPAGGSGAAAEVDAETNPPKAPGAAEEAVEVGVGVAGSGGAPLPPASSSTPLVSRLELPAPCAGIPYSEPLVPDVPGPHVWAQLSEPPSGLRFDTSTGTISGTPSEGGALRVGLVAAGRSMMIDVDLSLRDSCWFAHLAQADGGASPQLHVRDVFLTRDISLGAGQAVTDFAFSPDGHWIAFRAGALGEQRLFRFALPTTSVETPTPEAVPISFECSAEQGAGSCAVQEFAWSPDSRRLAVALRDSLAGRDYLSVVDVSLLDTAEASAPRPTAGSVDWLLGEADLAFSGQLLWGGSDWFGFWGLEAGIPSSVYEVFHFAFVDPGGEVSSITASLADLGLSPSLRAIPSGLALSYSDSRVITSIARSAEPESIVPLPFRGVLSPSGRLVSFATEEGRLQVSDLATPDEPFLESARDTCSDIVAWSAPIGPAGVERILCTFASSLQLFDYTPRANLAEVIVQPRLERQGGSALAPAGNLLATRRMLSASGRFVLLADAGSGAFSLFDLFGGDVDVGLPFRLPAAAEFAPTGDALALANTESLIEYALPRSLGRVRGYSTFGAGPALGPGCEESYWRDPRRWCGAPFVETHWLYSPRSQTLLLEGPIGALSLADVSVMPQRDARALPGALSACPAPCRAKPYAFRP